MNDKINLQELTELLALKSGISRKDSESFLRALFALMEEALIEDKQIKIKDLGTFKLISIEERESIDVRTGHRVVIPAHQKISFIPAAQLADVINEPFALFEPVEIEDKPENNLIQPETPHSEPTVVTPENIEPQEKPPVTDQSHDNNVKAADNAFSMENIFHLSKEDLERIRKNREEEKKIMNRRKLLVRTFSVLVVLIVIAGGIWYFMRTKQAKQSIVSSMPTAYELAYRDSVRRINEQLEGDTTKQSSQIDPIYGTTDLSDPNKNAGAQQSTAPMATSDVPKPSVTPPATTAPSSSEDKKTQTPVTDTKPATATAATTTPVQTKPTVTEQQPATTTTSKPANQEAQVAKPSVTTASPSSTEQSQTSNVKKRRIKTGERLTLIALSEYGNKAFWVYIYLENKNNIPNPNDVPIGLEVIIPPAQKYGINSNDPASVEKAKNMENEILQK